LKEEEMLKMLGKLTNFPRQPHFRMMWEQDKGVDPHVPHESVFTKWLLSMGCPENHH